MTSSRIGAHGLLGQSIWLNMARGQNLRWVGARLRPARSRPYGKVPAAIYFERMSQDRIRWVMSRLANKYRQTLVDAGAFMAIDLREFPSAVGEAALPVRQRAIVQRLVLGTFRWNSVNLDGPYYKRGGRPGAPSPHASPAWRLKRRHHRHTRHRRYRALALGEHASTCRSPASRPAPAPKDWKYQ